MSKPFFFRIDAGDLLNFATDLEGENMTVLQLAKELQRGESKIEFIQYIIDEAKGFKEKKRNSGRLGGLAKSSSAKAVLKQNIAKPSTPLASSSSSSSSSKEQSSSSDDDKFFNMDNLLALCVRYLGWNPFMSAGQAETMRPLTQIFKADVDRGFQAAAAVNAKSIYYVIKVAQNESEATSSIDDFDRLFGDKS